jgi:BirA family biotin operon repressor/biotin-[acetyl-CoA-carboxylase] ligase
VHARLGSTNAEAARLAPGPAWVLAGEQTMGRGRRGRPWASPPGNFHGSLVLAPDGPPDRVALRSFAAALALFDTCVALTGLPGAFSLKWPNDVLLNGGKLAGILLESAGSGGVVQHLVIGIGVNLIAAPTPDQVEPGALRPVSLLGETGLRVTPERFLDHLAPAYAGWETTLSTMGFAPLRAAWLSHAARLGEAIRARIGSETHLGIFAGIDDTGALILDQAGVRRMIPAADVFFQE